MQVRGLGRVRLPSAETRATLQAHSVLRYADWRAVIAEYVATRRGLDPADLVPRVVGHVSLALSAYEQWLESTDAELAGC